MILTCVLAFAALGLVVLAVQFSCLFSYQGKKEEAAAAAELPSAPAYNEAA